MRDKKKEHRHYILILLGLSVAFSCFMLLFLMFGGAGDATYYVATDGSDLNPGTEAQPWRTIQKAANTLVAGDTVYIKEGTYNERVIPQNSGSQGNYITYTAYPGHTVTIDGSGISLNWEGLFHIEQKNYIKVSGLRIINSAYMGVQVRDGGHHIIIEKNYIYNCQGSGVHVNHGSNNIIVDGNEVSEVCINSAQEGISLLGTDIFEVKNNHVHHFHKEGIDTKCGCSNGSIYKNYVHHAYSTYNIRPGIYVDAFADLEENIDVYQNTVHDTANGIALATEEGGELVNVNIYNNIAYNNLYSGVVITPYHTPGWKGNIKIINNIFYNNRWGIRIQNTLLENIIVRNNICSKNQYAQIHKQYPGEFIIDHNLIDGPTDIYGDNAVIGDPKFVNPVAGDFHLQPDSPAIDAGSSVDAPSVDYDDVIRPQGAGYDIGAYEFVVAGATGTISGTVTNPTVAPIQGAKVTDGMRTTTTNTAGQYTLSNVPVGTSYTVTVSKIGYQTFINYKKMFKYQRIKQQQLISS